MQGDNTGPQSSLLTPSPSQIPDLKQERNAGKNGYQSEKNSVNKKLRNLLIAVVAILFIALITTVIILAVLVKKTETYPSSSLCASQGAACPDFWIGYRGKCFYTSKEEENWSLGLKTCSSLNASLAVIDTQKELEFWVEMFRPFHYWFGLSRELNQTWKWSNGTEFKNQFPVRGEGFCAYLNGKGADSTLCSMEKLFLCSRPESCRNTG